MHIATMLPPWTPTFDPAAAPKWTVVAQQIDDNGTHRGPGVEPRAQAPGPHARAASCRFSTACDKNCGWERAPGAEKGGPAGELVIVTLKM